MTQGPVAANTCRSIPPQKSPISGRSRSWQMLSAIVRFNQSGLIPADLTTPDQSSVCDLMDAARLVGRTRRDDDSELAQLVHDRGIRQRLVGLGIELPDDLRGRLGRRDHAPPDGRLVTDKIGLGDRRHNGSKGNRLSLATASARSRPARMCAITSTGLNGMNEMRSPRRSVMAGAPPL